MAVIVILAGIVIIFLYRQQSIKSLKYKIQYDLSKLTNKENYYKFMNNTKQTSKSEEKSKLTYNNDDDNLSFEEFFLNKFGVLNSNEYYKSRYEGVIENNGYSFERHKIITEDGYINTAWRINNPLTYDPSKLPVLVNHGLLDTSYTFLALNISHSLIYLLADEGYDIWLPNIRGGTFSFEHIIYDSAELNSEYWDFTFHEIVLFDLPANINYVLEYTKKEKLNYIGHSQGGFLLLIGFTFNPNYYNNIINYYVSLGTVPSFINLVNTIIF